MTTLTNFTGLLFSLVTISNIIYNKQSQYDQITARNHWNAYYDYVIVGGGTVGSVLASRLSEDPSIHVLLLEAGGSETVSSNTPSLSETLLGSVMDWKILSTEQNYSCRAMNQNQCHLASGKVIGGTSSINRMYYSRGNPLDFQNWETSFGLESWSWKDIFPYMIRNENQRDPEYAKTGQYGLSGPVLIAGTYPDASSTSDNVLGAFIESSKSLSYRGIDLNIGTSNVTGLLQSMIWHGKRQSMSSVFLEPNIRSRLNLHVVSNSMVVRILFDQKKAIGVKFYHDWQQYAVFARREVVLSAGAFNSPKLLLLSGIGPRSELAKHEIPLLVDLPVGENLHDHVGTMGLNFVSTLEEPTISKQHLKQYFYYGNGPLAENRYAATVFQSPTLTTLKHKTRRESKNSPDLMLLVNVQNSVSRDATPELTKQRFNIKQDFWNSYYRQLKTSNKRQFAVVPIVLKPKSRGWVRLKSNNPFDLPLVNPNYLQHSYDIHQIVKGMREALRIVNGELFQNYNTELYSTMVPGCEKEFWSAASELDQLNNEIEIMLLANSHPSYPKINNHTTTDRPFFMTALNKQKQHTIKNPSQITPSTPFHYVSSLMSKLLLFNRNKSRPSLSKRFFGKVYRHRVSKNHVSHSNQTNMIDNDDHFINQLVDGFDFSSSSNDIIKTFSNSHRSIHRPKPPQSTVRVYSPLSIIKNPSNKTKNKQPILQATIGKTSNISKFFNQSSSFINLIDDDHSSFQSDSDNQKPSPTLLQSSSPFSSNERVPQSLSTRYLECVARTLTMPIGDYVGSCSMASSSKSGVVDHRFRVHGVHGLRVVDASIIPEITSGGIAPIAIMLGERGAEFIKEDQKQHNSIQQTTSTPATTISLMEA